MIHLHFSTATARRSRTSRPGGQSEATRTGPESDTFGGPEVRSHLPALEFGPLFGPLFTTLTSGESVEAARDGRSWGKTGGPKTAKEESSRGAPNLPSKNIGSLILIIRSIWSLGNQVPRFFWLCIITLDLEETGNYHICEA